MVGKKFNCKNCGECCGDFLPLSKGEIKKIQMFVTKNGIKNKQNDSMTCPFRNETFKKCDIYEVRPLICSDYNCKKSFFETSENLLKEVRKPISMMHTFFDERE